MKDRGFTLVELMAVIFIIGLLALIVTPIISDVIKNSKEKAYRQQIEEVIRSSERWAMSNNTVLPTEDQSVFQLSISTLKSGGFLKNINVINPVTNEEMNGCIFITYQADSFQYNYEYEETCFPIDVEPSTPELTAGMIPVIYNGSLWIKADTSSEWYDYSSQEWANAVTVTSANRDTYLAAPPGSTIPMSVINTMWVWIPRYKYAISTGTEEREINIVFESKTTPKSTGNAIDTNYLTHPAFTFGTTELSGIWIGKFETTGTIDTPTILPNSTSLRSQTVKAMYDASRTMENNTTYGFDTDANIHMAKDSEWGATVYLSYSQYGKYGNTIYTGINKELYQNKSNGYITGVSNGTPSQGTTNPQCSYHVIEDRGSGTGSCGGGASTTGNIYGVYDMSGGAYEYTMSMYRPTDTTIVTDSSGFGANTTTGTVPTSEYWDRYTTTTAATACSEGICYGNALSETSGWYGDDNAFAYSNYPWIIRGGRYSDSSYAGLFAFNNYGGNTADSGSFRLVQLKQ